MGLYLAIRNRVRSVARFLFLNKYRQFKRARHLSQRAHQLVERCAKLDSIEQILDDVLQDENFGPVQQPEEILSLLYLLRDNQTAKILEIGGYRGGTLFLFSRILKQSGKILSVDLDYSPERIQSVKPFHLPGISIDCLAADSHLEKTKTKVEQHFEGQKIDFLFIDGDHTYEGVKSDFEMFCSLVKPGGIIAFHDIVPDFKTRHGIETGSYVGEVPQYWEELKKCYSDTSEFIQDPEQDGYGIGVIRWNGK